MRLDYLCLAASVGFSAASYFANDTLEVEVIAGSQLLARDPHTDLGRRQTTGRCGADNGGQSCGTLCCSHWGYCGDGDDYCRLIADCQPQYGRCGDAPAPTTSSTTTSISSTSSSSTSLTTSTISTTSTSVSSTSSTSSIPLPSGTLITTNGMCGNSTTCAGSGFGPCCSQFWYCGSAAAYCGTGCNPLFGSCSGVISSSSSSTQTSTSTSSSTSISTTSTSVTTSSTSPSSTPTGPPGLPVSQDGTCGNGITCTGSTSGPCCSQYGYCGADPIYCRLLLGCQPNFGTCDST